MNKCPKCLKEYNSTACGCYICECGHRIVCYGSADIDEKISRNLNLEMKKLWDFMIQDVFIPSGGIVQENNCPKWTLGDQTVFASGGTLYYNKLD